MNEAYQTSARLTRMEDDIRQIKSAVIGDPQFGHWGLVQRANAHDKRLKSLESLRVWLWGASAATLILVSAGYSMLRDFIGKWPTR